MKLETLAVIIKTDDGECRQVAMKTEIKKLHIENDVVNNEPKLILTDETGKEWVMSSRTVCSEGGSIPVIIAKENDWYFDDKNKPITHETNN